MALPAEFWQEPPIIRLIHSDLAAMDNQGWIRTAAIDQVEKGDIYVITGAVSASRNGVYQVYEVEPCHYRPNSGESRCKIRRLPTSEGAIWSG